MNIDLKHCDDHGSTKAYIDMLFSNLCCPIITKPTRITHSSQTIIDHIYSNCVDRNFTSGIIVDNISDHFPVFVSTSLKTTNPKVQRKMVRNYRNFDKIAFSDAIKNINITASENASEYYQEFMHKVNQITDEHACTPS